MASPDRKDLPVFRETLDLKELKDPSVRRARGAVLVLLVSLETLVRTEVRDPQDPPDLR